MHSKTLAGCKQRRVTCGSQPSVQRWVGRSVVWVPAGLWNPLSLLSNGYQGFLL